MLSTLCMVRSAPHFMVLKRESLGFSNFPLLMPQTLTKCAKLPYYLYILNLGLGREILGFFEFFFFANVKFLHPRVISYLIDAKLPFNFHPFILEFERGKV